MVPGVIPGGVAAVSGANAALPGANAARRAVLGGGLGLVAIALIAASFALFAAAARPAPPQPASTFTTVAAAAPAPSAPAIAGDTPASATLSGNAAIDAAHTPAPPAPRAAAPATPAPHAVAWTIDAGASSVAFTITYSGQPYEGAFDRWRADIAFDANDLAHSSANVTFETASAHTSDQMQTSQLGGETWLDTQHFPSASFRTTSIRHLSGNAYQAQATLTLKGRTKTVSLPFTLSIAGNTATMNGQITLNRQEFGIGAGDTSIGDTVAVKVRVVATRAA
jgi:polyisoprenoid-binding protein YceI